MDLDSGLDTQVPTELDSGAAWGRRKVESLHRKRIPED